MTDFVWRVNYKPLNPHWQTFARLVDKQQQIDLEKEHKTPKKPSGIPLFSKFNFCFLFTFIASWKLDIVCHSTTVTFPKRFTLNTINKVHCYIVNLARCYLMVKVSSQGNPKGNFLLFFNWFELQIITKQNYQKVLHRQSEFLRVFFFLKNFFGSIIWYIRLGNGQAKSRQESRQTL